MHAISEFCTCNLKIENRTAFRSLQQNVSKAWSGLFLALCDK